MWLAMLISTGDSRPWALWYSGSLVATMGWFRYGFDRKQLSIHGMTAMWCSLFVSVIARQVCQWMSVVGHIVVYDTCSSPLVGLHHFYFAKLAQAAFCKYLFVIAAQILQQPSAFSSSRPRPKENGVFREICWQFLAFACLLPAAPICT